MANHITLASVRFDSLIIVDIPTLPKRTLVDHGCLRCLSTSGVMEVRGFFVLSEAINALGWPGIIEHVELPRASIFLGSVRMLGVEHKGRTISSLKGCSKKMERSGARFIFDGFNYEQ